MADTVRLACCLDNDEEKEENIRKDYGKKNEDCHV